MTKPVPNDKPRESKGEERCATCGMDRTHINHLPIDAKAHHFAPAPAPTPERCAATSRTGRHCDGVLGHDGTHWTILADVLAPAPTPERCAECGFPTPCGMEDFPAHQRRAERDELAALRASLDAATGALREIVEYGPDRERTPNGWTCRYCGRTDGHNKVCVTNIAAAALAQVEGVQK